MDSEKAIGRKASEGVDPVANRTSVALQRPQYLGSRHWTIYKLYTPSKLTVSQPTIVKITPTALAPREAYIDGRMSNTNLTRVSEMLQ